MGRQGLPDPPSTPAFLGETTPFCRVPFNPHLECSQLSLYSGLAWSKFKAASQSSRSLGQANHCQLNPLIADITINDIPIRDNQELFFLPCVGPSHNAILLSRMTWMPLQGSDKFIGATYADCKGCGPQRCPPAPGVVTRQPPDQLGSTFSAAPPSSSTPLPEASASCLSQLPWPHSHAPLLFQAASPYPSHRAGAVLSKMHKVHM